MKKIQNKQPKKTAYCIYYLECNREEDCFNGAYCPVYKFNPTCARKEVDQYEDD